MKAMREKAPPTAAELHEIAFKTHPTFGPMALAACNAWGRGQGSAQSCMLHAIRAAYEIGTAREPLTFSTFAAHFGLGVKLPAPREEIDEDEPEGPEDEDEPFAARVARLAAEARAKPKKRKRRA